MRKPFTAELQKAKRNGRDFATFAERQQIAHETVAGLGAVAAGMTVAPPPVAVDNGEVLRAIAELSGKLDRFLAMDKEQIELIQVEIADISGRIKATKVEMAALRHPLAGEDKFAQASEELSAVVSSTEEATNIIMAATEELEEIVQEVRAQLPDGYQSSRINDMNDLIVRIFEACNFQDLTGQRITKVVRALSFIEERVDAMMGVWNRREFEAMPLPPSVVHRDNDLELHGPAEHGVDGNFSQADIDALFG